MRNTLFYGDNLGVLREHIPDESVDLIYLDPPFNSNASYNVLFKEKTGEESPAQIKAFTDTWQWTEETERTFYQDIIYNPAVPSATREMIAAFRQVLGEKNDMMAYLVMMAPRLVELRRVLKPTGSLYLHCDPTASHYLKALLDTVFGPTSFINEIIWKRSSAHSDTRQGSRHFGRVTDTILFYSIGSDRAWNQLYVPYDEEYVNRDYRRVDESGRRYRISDMSGPGGAAKGNPFYEFLGVTRHWRYAKDKDGGTLQGRSYRPDEARCRSTVQTLSR